MATQADGNYGRWQLRPMATQARWQPGPRRKRTDGKNIIELSGGNYRTTVEKQEKEGGIAYMCANKVGKVVDANAISRGDQRDKQMG